MAYFDKLVTIQYWRISSGGYKFFPTNDLNFVGECSPGVFYKVAITSNTISQMYITEAKALTSTENYFFIKSITQKDYFWTNH